MLDMLHGGCSIPWHPAFTSGLILITFSNVVSLPKCQSQFGMSTLPSRSCTLRDPSASAAMCVELHLARGRTAASRDHSSPVGICLPWPAAAARPDSYLITLKMCQRYVNFYLPQQRACLRSPEPPLRHLTKCFQTWRPRCCLCCTTVGPLRCSPGFVGSLMTGHIDHPRR